MKSKRWQSWTPDQRTATFVPAVKPGGGGPTIEGSTTDLEELHTFAKLYGCPRQSLALAFETKLTPSN